jgi:hypothetical protein
MIQFGQLIARMQAHPHQQGQELFFLAENVPLAGRDLERVEHAFGGIPPLVMDAAYWSPCKRKRCFFTNLPICDFLLSNDCWQADGDWNSRPASCLDEGYDLPVNVLRKSNRRDTEFSQRANTFMASEGRINDRPRMLVVKKYKAGTKGKQDYVGRTYTVRERERMLGFPDGYVEHAVQALFDDLLYNALIFGSVEFYRQREPGITWRETLRPEYQKFAGQDFKIRGLGMDLEKEPTTRMELKMAPPTNNEGVSVQLLYLSACLSTLWVFVLLIICWICFALLLSRWL